MPPPRVSNQSLPETWVAKWIEPIEASGTVGIRRPAYHLAGEFSLEGPVKSAIINATAHGIYELFVNGERVGDAELTPGFTAYRKRLQVQVFDVGDMLTDGVNAIGALLSDGWWRGQHGIVRATDAYGSTTALLVQLHIEYETGETSVFSTDETWVSTPSHILGADLIAGEIHDFRKRVPQWADAGADRSSWDPVRVTDYGFAQLCPTVGPPVRRIEELPSVSVKEIAPSKYIVDFGQNSNGWIRLESLGPAGCELTIAYGECLDRNGDLIQSNVASSPLAPPRDPAPPFQTDQVVSAGEGESFEPRHSTKGFRYVRVEGHPGPLDAADITSVVVHSDLRRIGGFECSDDEINRLHQAAEWSFRSNACDIPTDCPTRERSGWTGDWQLFVETAAFLYDVTDFSVKWLADLASDQLDSGAVTSIVPDPSPNAPGWHNTHGSSGWGDAAIHVPWELYRATARTDILEAQLDSMIRWVDFAAARAAEGRHWSRVKARPDPAPHETYLWDTGWHFGEWLEPGVDMDTLLVRLATEDHAPVATAYLYRSATELSRVATVLRKPDLAERYADLAANVLAAWRAEFVDPDGRVKPLTQANLVRALAFDLSPNHLRAAVASALVELIRKAGTHLGTGFLSTPFLLPVLADSGHLDVAYELLFRDTEPSWLYMLEAGATTVWEDWDGVRPDGSVAHSLNHYSKGAVISFLHRYVAGLQIVDPGYRRFRFKPHPGGGIAWAAAYHESPHGRIEVSWETSDSGGVVEVVVPLDTECRLELPDRSSVTLGPGSHQRKWDLQFRVS